MGNSNDGYSASIYEWFLKHKDETFRYWVYRQYPTSREFGDDTFINCCAETGRLVEVTNLGDGDFMLSLMDRDVDDGIEYIKYYRMSDIQLAWCSLDGDEE